MDHTGMPRDFDICEYLILLFSQLIPPCIRCLGHVIQLANGDMMKHVTNIAAVETAAAIWKLNPKDPNSHLSNGSLDAVSTLCTVAIKVCYSFKKLIL